MGQPVQSKPLQHGVDGRCRHAESGVNQDRAKPVSPPQVDDLADHLRRGPSVLSMAGLGPIHPSRLPFVAVALDPFAGGARGDVEEPRRYSRGPANHDDQPGNSEPAVPGVTGAVAWPTKAPLDWDPRPTQLHTGRPSPIFGPPHPIVHRALGITTREPGSQALDQQTRMTRNAESRRARVASNVSTPTTVSSGSSRVVANPASAGP